MMKRDECLKVLAHYHTDQIVVAAYQAAQEWLVIKPHVLNYTAIGAMGQASSHALGLALGRPNIRVLVLDGDGSLLMNLGSLVTIAGQEPENLVHFLFEDGVYFTTGSQPVPGAGRVSLAGMAKDAGFRHSHEFDNLEDFASELPSIMKEPGPVFVCLKVDHPDEQPPVYIGNTGAAMKRLAQKLGGAEA